MATTKKPYTTSSIDENEERIVVTREEVVAVIRLGEDENYSKSPTEAALAAIAVDIDGTRYDEQIEGRVYRFKVPSGVYNDQPDVFKVVVDVKRS